MFELEERDDFGWSMDSMIQAMFVAVLVVAIMPMLPAMQSAQKFYQSQLYQGFVSAFELAPKGDELNFIDLVNNFPYNPWIWGFFVNRGPNTIYIGINEPDNWLTILSGGTREVSHIGADRRIEVIYYKCLPGESSITVAEGHY